MELVASNNKVIATGTAVLRELLPSLNEDYNFVINLSGHGGGVILQSSGIIHDIEALKGIKYIIK